MIAAELSFTQLLDAVRKLSPSEKLELNEMIWKEDISIPVEHQKLVYERIKTARSNSQVLHDWDAVSKKLNS
ncbi:MAG: hypothetical protein Q8S11_04525 [Daejeonella sp.]|uniref:hypothetical protein n=1 Tax=Daejeonella sp. TaxID=2805397 RepID=UPI0027331DDC|nr:hypothetical protein [Daejeonella sp.]MDP3467572.1 hypothetical protein [Daejeonella sp.]